MSVKSGNNACWMLKAFTLRWEFIYHWLWSNLHFFQFSLLCGWLSRYFCASTDRKVYCCIFNHLFYHGRKKNVLTKRELSLASVCNYQLMQKKAVKFLPRFMSFRLSTNDTEKRVFFYCNSFAAPLHHYSKKSAWERTRGLLHKKGIFLHAFSIASLLLAFPIVRWTISIAQCRIYLFVFHEWVSERELLYVVDCNRNSLKNNCAPYSKAFVVVLWNHQTIELCNFLPREIFSCAMSTAVAMRGQALN